MELYTANKKERLKKIESNKHNSKKFFSGSNTIKQGLKQQTRMIINQNGDLVTNEKEVEEEFKIYFDKLLNNTTT